MEGNYIRTGESNSKKKYLAIVGFLGVVALVGIVAHGHGASQVESQNLAGTGSTPYDHLFRSWMKHFNRNYESFEELTKRYQIFVQNLEFINHTNSDTNDYTLGVNQFADLTREEFKAYHLGGNAPLFNEGELLNEGEINWQSVPSSIDWTTQGIVTPVKNQGQCGSCWAFSTTGALEGLHAQKTGQLLSFSEQQLVDCSTANDGCGGGWPSKAFQYTASYGIETESEYPYEAVNDTCRYTQGVWKNSSYKRVPSEQSVMLKAAVAQQPVSVLIEADQDVFRFYSGGVLTGSCGTNLDHAVLAVGYGVDGETKFWKVKNSWGTSWGENGYVRMERTDDEGAGKCGIAIQPTYPVA